MSLAGGILLGGCGGDSDDATAPEPTRVPTQVVISPESATATFLSQGVQFSAQVLDQAGLPMSGVSVTWASSAPSVASVNASGLATAVGVGMTTLTATAGSASGNATLVVTQAVTSFVIASGNQQTGNTNEALGTPVLTQVLDAGGAPIVNVPVTYSITSSGGGRATPAQTVTSADGFASTVWTLGGTEENVLVASIAEAPPLEFAATAVVKDPVSALGGGTVTSPDGLVTLDIPANALSEAMAIDIRPVPRESWSTEISDSDPVGEVYEFLPDGLEFSVPATLTMQLGAGIVAGLARADNQFPALFAASREADAPSVELDSVTTAYELTPGTATAVVQISNFSRKWFNGNPGDRANIHGLDGNAPVVSGGGELGPDESDVGVSQPVMLWAFNATTEGSVTVWFEFFQRGAVTWDDGSTKMLPLGAGTTGAGFHAGLDDRSWTCNEEGEGWINVAYLFNFRPAGQKASWRNINTAQDIVCKIPLQIMATASPPITIYTLSPEVPEGTSFFAWSGANCGSVTGSTTSTMVWDHGQEGCEHAGEAHPDATISLFLSGQSPTSGEPFELRCTYIGAASGKGPECVPVS